MAKFDLRKVLGLYDQERQARQVITSLKTLLGVDVDAQVTYSILDKAGLSSLDAEYLAHKLMVYAEAKRKSERG